MRRAVTFLFHDVIQRDPAESGFPGRAAHRYKLSVGEFEAQLAALARARHDQPILMNAPAAGSDGPPPFALTVDDGGISYYTQVADRLEALGWRAHCLVTTGCLGRPGFLGKLQVRELHRRGHVIGTHSVSHPARFSACGHRDMVREWTDSRAVLADVLGEDVTVASVPGGHYSRAVAASAREAGLRLLFTSEPETRARVVEGCLVVGRFTCRPGAPVDFAARLARLDASARLREWILWNGKKVAKGVLGPVYLRLSGARA